MTSRNRIEFGKAHKILREIASLISDVVFLFYKINLDKVIPTLHDFFFRENSWLGTRRRE